MLDKPRNPSAGRDRMSGSFLGPEFSREQINEQLTKCGAVFYELQEEELIRQTAKALVEGKQLAG